jgi:hypothetical protein
MIYKYAWPLAHYRFTLKIKYYTPPQGKWSIFYILPWQYEWMNTSLIVLSCLVCQCFIFLLTIRRISRAYNQMHSSVKFTLPLQTMARKSMISFLWHANTQVHSKQFNWRICHFGNQVTHSVIFQMQKAVFISDHFNWHGYHSIPVVYMADITCIWSLG